MHTLYLLVWVLKHWFRFLENITNCLNLQFTFFNEGFFTFYQKLHIWQFVFILEILFGKTGNREIMMILKLKILFDYIAV